MAFQLFYLLHALCQLGFVNEFSLLFCRNILRRLLHQWIRFVASKDDYERMESLRRHFQTQVALELPDYSPASSLM